MKGQKKDMPVQAWEADVRAVQKRRGEDMLRQALLEMEMEEAERAWTEPVPEEAEALYEETLAEFEQLIGREMRRQARPKIPWRTIRRVASVAAAVIAALSIGTVVAVASSDRLQQQLQRLVVEFTPRSMEVRMEPSEEFMEVPSGYEGDYFISYIPEGFEVFEAGEGWVDFRTEDDRWLRFDELESNAAVSYDTEDAEVSYEEAFDKEVMVLEKEGNVTCVWAFKDRYFLISLDGPKEEAMKVVRSLTHILR